MAMSELGKLEDELNKMIVEGKGMEAFEKFYADDVVMEEPTGDPARVGKEACRKSEKDFAGSIEEFHAAKLLASAVGDGVTMSEWIYDFKLRGQPRTKLQEIARRQWRNGKVVSERFYYHRPA
jgi:SnoaL-like protein